MELVVGFTSLRDLQRIGAVFPVCFVVLNHTLVGLLENFVLPSLAIVYIKLPAIEEFIGFHDNPMLSQNDHSAHISQLDMPYHGDVVEILT